MSLSLRVFTFDPGVLSRSLLVAIVDDGVREEPEEFQVL